MNCAIKKIYSLLLGWGLLMMTNASPLPFLETFETVDGVSLGTVNGQNGWLLVASGTGDIQSDVVHASSQALEIQNTELSHDLSSNNSAVWLHFQARCSAAPDSNPSVPAENSSLAFYVNTNLNIVVYSNTVPVELSAQIQTNVWIRFDIYCDYDDLYWDLSMNGINVAAGLPLYSTNSQVGSLLIGNKDSSPVYIDQIDVTDTEQTAGGLPDSDSDEIPDWWAEILWRGHQCCCRQYFRQRRPHISADLHCGCQPDLIRSLRGIACPRRKRLGLESCPKPSLFRILEF